MALAAAQRAYDRLHKDKPFHDGTFKTWAAEESELTPFHYMDGVRIYVSTEDRNPGDLFTTKVEAAPWDEPVQ